MPIELIKYEKLPKITKPLVRRMNQDPTTNTVNFNKTIAGATLPWVSVLIYCSGLL